MKFVDYRHNIFAAHSDKNEQMTLVKLGQNENNRFVDL
jgi:hypothetical protein